MIVGSIDRHCYGAPHAMSSASVCIFVLCVFFLTCAYIARNRTTLLFGPIAESLARPQHPGFRVERGWVNVADFAAVLARVKLQNSDSPQKFGWICHDMIRL